MKLKFIYLSILLFSLNCFSQSLEPIKQQKEVVADLPLYNFYYLSKYLTNPNLETKQKTAVYAQFLTLIGTEKLEYLLASNDNDLKDLREILNRVILQSPATYKFLSYLRESKWTELDNDFKLNAKDKMFVQEIKSISEEISELKIEQINQLKTYNDDQDKIIKEIDRIRTDTVIIKARQDSAVLLQAQLAAKVNAFDQSKSVRDVLIKEKSDILNGKIDTFSSDYFKANPKYIFSEVGILDAQKFYGQTEAGQSLQLTNNYVQSVQSQGSSGFQLPSQAQLIDAMALFLANRAKQEAAIWFMDQVRSRLQNPLIKDAFPETIKLIHSLEDYKVPNFGTEWRYAISTDFIKMPEHIADSEWVRLTIGDDTKLNGIRSSIKLGYKLNGLMAGNFNYRDIIESLYLDELKVNYTASNSYDKNIRNSIILLYSLTKELYSIDYISDKPNYRLLNFEELNALNKDQWNILTSLIYLKYFYDRESNNGGSNPIFNNNININININAVKVVLSQMLINLSQFDKIRNDLVNVSGKEKMDFSKQNFYSIWKIIDQIVDNLNEICFADAVKCKSAKENSKMVSENLKTTLAVYESLQTHNFNGVIQNTFKLINQFKNNDDISTLDGYEVKYISENQYSFTKNEQKLFIWKLNDGFAISKDSTGQKDKIVINDFSKFRKLWSLTSFNRDDAKELIKLSGFNIIQKNILRQFDLDLAELIRIFDSVDNVQPSMVKSAITTTSSESTVYISKVDAKYRDQLIKLTSFFGDILTATDSKQMADVISSHALPPTSYKLKRRVAFSIDLNGYVGAYGAYSFPSAGSTFNEGWTGGITAPIGVTFTWKVGKNNWGLSANVVDLGNIVNHYLTSSEKYYKDVHFSEVFAPNANLLYSIPKTPLVAFIGASFLPLKSTVVDGVTKNYRAFDLTIIQAGIKIDIPLVNLHKSQ